MTEPLQRLLRAALVAASLLAVPAQAAPLEPLADLSAESVRKRVVPGDSIRATVADGRVFELTVQVVAETSMTGKAANGKRYRISYSALRSLDVAKSDGVTELAGPAPAKGPAVWFGLNVGMLSGEVDVPCSDPSSSDCSESGVLGSFGANLTFAGPFAARARVLFAKENTEDPPVELAALIGPRLGDHFYFMVGASHIANPDDEFDGDSTNAVAWELIWAPRSTKGAGVQISLHGAVGSDLNYAGISTGVRFGKLH